MTSETPRKKRAFTHGPGTFDTPVTEGVARSVVLAANVTWMVVGLASAACDVFGHDARCAGPEDSPATLALVAAVMSMPLVCFGSVLDAQASERGTPFRCVSMGVSAPA